MMELQRGNGFTLTLMPTHPFTSSVLRVLEHVEDRDSRHRSVTPTIPNKLRKKGRTKVYSVRYESF